MPLIPNHMQIPTTPETNSKWDWNRGADTVRVELDYRYAHVVCARCTLADGDVVGMSKPNQGMTAKPPSSFGHDFQVRVSYGYILSVQGFLEFGWDNIFIHIIYITIKKNKQDGCGTPQPLQYCQRLR